MFFNAETYDFDTIPTWGDIPESRRNHSSCVIGRTLLVFGGVDKTG